MNLHQIVSGAIGTINPFVTATLEYSTGSTIGADGSRVPTYATPISAQVQVQSLTYNDLQQIDGLNIQGVRRAIYLNGEWQGAVRPDGKGGDLLKFPSTPGGAVQTWLVVCVLEDWAAEDGWTKLCVTLQDGS